MASYRNRQALLEENPKLAEALDDILGHINTTMTQTNSSPNGQVTPPPTPNSLVVNGAHGIFDAAISDNSSEVNRGINYFLEYSKSPSFSAPTQISLGPSRNWRGHLGNQTLYWRANSSYLTSPRSDHAYHGTQTQPVAVSGGGVNTGPELSPSQGSGTSAGGTGSDGAFGNQPTRRVRRGN